MKKYFIIFTVCFSWDAAYCDEVIVSQTFANGSSPSLFEIKKSMLDDSPSWDGNNDLPITIKKVREIASNEIKMKHELEVSEIQSITIARVLKTDKWYFVIHCVSDNNSSNNRQSFDFIILMNGLIVPPK